MLINFVTGNDNKYAIASSICKEHGIELKRLVLDIDEIQGEDPEKIITNKAYSAYDIVKEPIVVSDDSWSFSGLNGFPGPYMKSINHWFTTQDFLDLMKNKKDRRGIIIQLLAYYDGSELTIFRKDATGRMIEEPKGESPIPLHSIYVSDTDNGKTLAELDNLGQKHSKDRLNNQPEPWHDMAHWLKTKYEKVDK